MRCSATTRRYGDCSNWRVQAALGRTFDERDDSPGTPETVMLTHAYWQRKFGADPSAIGRAITIEGRPREIIGVLPAAFSFLDLEPAVLMPFRFNRAEIYVGNFSYQAVARLAPGATVEGANEDIARMIPLTMERFPLPPGFTAEMFDRIRMGPRVRPFSEDAIGEVADALWVIFGVVAMVLLIACANVANLFLVRSEARQHELAVRTALGASRRQVAGSLLAESVGLGLAGGALGLLLAVAAIRLLRWLGPDGLPRLGEIGIDPIAVSFTLAVSILTGILFGLVPAFKLRSPRMAALQEGGRSASEGRGRNRVRNALVVAEVALALVLLVSSGLMIRTFQALRSVDPGFVEPEEVLTFRVAIPEAQMADDTEVIRTYEEIARRLEVLPGVTSVGLSSSITMDRYDSNDAIFVEEFPVPEGQMPPMRRFKWVSEHYFETMGSRLVAGRTLNWADAYNRMPVAVVSENLAREYWEDPRLAVGKRIRETPKSRWREIVGVVTDERDDGVARPAPKVVYWPMMMADFWDDESYVRRNMGFAVRTARADSPTLLREVQQAVWSVNPALPVASIRTLAEIRQRSMAETSFALVMLAIAAVVALLLGAVGVYGVIAYLAAQRTREVGIRMALGAQKVDVARLFLLRGLALTGVGVAVGVTASLGLTRLMATMLYGVTPTDPLTFASVSAGLVAVALAATSLPAWRASRQNPVQALRST